MNPAITFRDAQRTDLPHLVELDAICFPPDIAYPTGVMRHFAFSANSKSIIALDGDVIVGLIIIRSSAAEGEVVTVDVHPDSRSAGLGHALMRKAEDWVKSRGGSILALEVDEDNAAALSLYMKLGFIVRERYKESRKRRLVMTKQL